MSQQTFTEYCQERAGRIPDDLELDVRLQLNSQYEARQEGKYIHVPIYHPSHVSITHASHFSIALPALISLYISHLIFSFSSAAFRKIAQAGGAGQGQGEYSAMVFVVLCVVVEHCFILL